MSLNDETAAVLKTGTRIGLVIIAVGLVLSIAGITDILLLAGIVVLIFSPVAGVAVSTKCLIQEKDTYWVRVAFILIVVIIAGMLFSYLT